MPVLWSDADIARTADISSICLPPRRSIEEDRAADTRFEITCSMVEIYNEVVHDLLSADVKRQVELQKTATGFDNPAITTIGARGARRWPKIGPHSTVRRRSKLLAHMNIPMLPCQDA